MGSESSRKWLVLSAMCFAFFLAATDTTIMNLAIVWVQKDFSVPLSTVQWVLSGYFLSFASFIIAGGKLSDHFGHRIMFAIGVSIFLIFSACGALSQNIWQLIISRIIQGFGGALFWPSVNALTMHHFDEKSLGTAVGILMGVAGFAMSVGPPLGGFLIRLLSWRYILWLNVPVCILALIMLFAFVPEDEKKERGKLDYLAMFLLILGLFGIFFSLNRGDVLGFGKFEVIIPLIIGCLILFGFIMNEVFSKRPLIDFELLKNPVYTTSILMRLGLGASFFTILYTLAIYFQHIIGLSPVISGVYYLPMTVIMGVIPTFFGRIEKKIGALIPVYLGMLLVIISFSSITFLDLTHLSFGSLFVPLFLYGLGFGLVLPANLIVALKDVSKKFTGLAVGLLYTCVLISGTTLVIVSTIVIKHKGTQHTMQKFQEERITLNSAQKADVEKTVTGLQDTTAFSKKFPSRQQPLVLEAIRYGFEQAFFFVLRICVFICFVTLVLFWIVQRYKIKKNLLKPD